jgi:tight adherence protein C
MDIMLIAFIWLFAAGVMVIILPQSLSYFRLRERLFQEDLAPAQKETQLRDSFYTQLKKWIRGSGLESEQALPVFIASCLVMLIAALIVSYQLGTSDVTQAAIRSLNNLPGTLGGIFVPIVYIAPYVIFVMLASFPWLFIRLLRRQRMEKIEQDLPIFLEFLVTLSEAGLGFDEAIIKVTEVYDRKSPLVKAFEDFQKEVRAGNSRLRSFWRLKERLDIGSVKRFVSALINSEQTGGRMSEILRNQAADSLNRRRLKALEMASALPVKLLFPMMICFLPGIFIVTLGPAAFEFIKAMDSVIRTVR